MPKLKGGAADDVFCNALLKDARLIEEALKVDTLRAEAVIKKSGSKTQVRASTEATNEINIVFEGSSAAHLQITSKVNVFLFSPPESTLAMVTYSNHYTSLFQIKSSRGLSQTAAPPLAALAPYIAQANWLAIRRADGGLAATGLASTRLAVPDALEDIVQSQDGQAVAS